MSNLFFKRALAFVIDLVVVNLIISIFSAVLPLDNAQKLSQESINISEQYLNGEIDDKTYLSLVYDLEYDLKKETIPIELITIVVYLLYFVVLPYYSNGKTLGKRLNKIKVIKSNDAKLDMNDLVIRSLINNGLIFSLLELALIFIIQNHKIFVIISVIFTYLEGLIMIISIIMIIFTKKKLGIHGIISKTEVVEG